MYCYPFDEFINKLQKINDNDNQFASLLYEYGIPYKSTKTFDNTIWPNVDIVKASCLYRSCLINEMELYYLNRELTINNFSHKLEKAHQKAIAESGVYNFPNHGVNNNKSKVLYNYFLQFANKINDYKYTSGKLCYDFALCCDKLIKLYPIIIDMKRKDNILDNLKEISSLYMIEDIVMDIIIISSIYFNSEEKKSIEYYKKIVDNEIKDIIKNKSNNIESIVKEIGNKEKEKLIKEQRKKINENIAEHFTLKQEKELNKIFKKCLKHNDIFKVFKKANDIIILDETNDDLLSFINRNLDILNNIIKRNSFIDFKNCYLDYVSEIEVKINYQIGSDDLMRKTRNKEIEKLSKKILNDGTPHSEIYFYLKDELPNYIAYIANSVYYLYNYLKANNFYKEFIDIPIKIVNPITINIMIEYFQMKRVETIKDAINMYFIEYSNKVKDHNKLYKEKEKNIVKDFNKIINNILLNYNISVDENEIDKVISNYMEQIKLDIHNNMEYEYVITIYGVKDVYKKWLE